MFWKWSLWNDPRTYVCFSSQPLYRACCPLIVLWCSFGSEFITITMTLLLNSYLMIQISVDRKFDSLLFFFSSDIKGTIIQETLVIYEVCVSDVFFVFFFMEKNRSSSNNRFPNFCQLSLFELKYLLLYIFWDLQLIFQ